MKTPAVRRFSSTSISTLTSISTSTSTSTSASTSASTSTSTSLSPPPNGRHPPHYSKTSSSSTFLPIPHRSLPDPSGQDLDFISVAHSHLINRDWTRLDPMSTSLTPFRLHHILLLTKKDPVLSLELFQWASRHSPPSLDHLAQSLLLHILSRSKNHSASLETLLRDVILRSHRDPFDLLLHSYRLCDSSPRIFDFLFRTHARSKKLRAATDTFRRMRDFGFFPTAVSCNVFLSSLTTLRRYDVALSFYREMRRSRISPNVYTLNIHIATLFNSGRLEKAMRVFGDMDEGTGIAPVVSTYNTVISGICRNGLLPTALNLKNEMREKGLQPNVITYNTLINAFCKEGKVRDANRLLREMRSADLEPNSITYAALINGYCSIGDNEMAAGVHEEMLKSGVKASVLTYNALIRGLCNEGKTRKATKLVKELDGFDLSPNFWTFFSLLKGHCKRGNSERAFQVYEVMKKCGCLPNGESYKLLISTFCDNKDFEGVLQILKEMLDAWMVPERGLLVGVFERLFRYGKSVLVEDLVSRYKGKKFLLDCLDEGRNLASQPLKGLQ